MIRPAAPRLMALILLTLSSLVHAQNGDRAGEIQAPPPAHLQSPPAPVLSATDAIKSFRLPPGFQVQLVAAEPLVFDPVAMEFGPDGRLWVVEMRAYMPNVDGTGEDAPIGTIATLEDIDGDGRMDRRVEFAGGLVMPRAISLVANGVLVAEPPKLWFLEDTDRDGKADRRTEVANDYGDTTNPEHTANGLMRALDNWIYSANHTVRFRQHQGQWRREPTIFRGQWGITQDDAGRLYYNNNSEPLRMDVLPAEYLRRNPRLVAPDGANVRLARPQDTPVWPGRITLGVNRGYRILRADGTLPELTAACGPVIYRGDRFPREFQGDAFIAEPSANLVKRLRVVSHGGLPAVRNAYDQAEFLTSTDERFRPVNLYNGLDGALYVVDMYRGIIQHRIYLTTYLRNQIQARGLDAPVGLGRIWRITTTPSARAPRPNLDKATSRRLVQTLAHREAWWRDTAQRLLVERQDRSVTADLRLLARGASKAGRMHALWTLDGLDAVDWASVQAALADVDVDVAVTGARLAERFFATEPARVVAAITARAAWGEPGFLRQAALSLGSGSAESVHGPLMQLAMRHGHLPFMADALVSSLGGRELAALESLVVGGPGAPAVTRSLAAAILQSRDAAQIERLMGHLQSRSPEWLRDAILDGIDRFIPGEGARKRTAFLPAEPRLLLEFSRGGGAQAARAGELAKHLRWRGQPVDPARALATLSEAERARFERGREEFAVCAACHQPTGEGMAGLAPPLVGSPFVTGNAGALVRIVLQGKTSGDTTMPPLAALEDERIAALLTYVRRSWGHESAPVTAAQVQAVRSETRLRDEPWTEAELATLD